MDRELREYLDRRFDRVEERIGALEDRVGAVEERIGALQDRMTRTEVAVEEIRDQIRLVAEGHSLLYGAICRHYDEVRDELRFVQSLLKNWNDLVTNRLRELERRVREKAG